jgi:hypothetical protein
MGNEDNGHGDVPVEVGLKSFPTSPTLSNEHGNVVVDVDALLRSCSMKGLSPKVAERIRQADVDHDGALSVDELIEVIRTEMQAVSDRKLFRNILIALFVAVLVLVATLCGTVYAIVDLSKEVKNDNGVLVSSSSGDVMATGTAQQTVTVGPELLSMFNFPSSLSKAHSVVIPAVDGGNTTVYKVGKMTASPSTGTLEVNTVDGTTLFMNQSGVYKISDEGDNNYSPLLLSDGNRRRKLMSKGDDGVPGHSGATIVMDMGTTGDVTSDSSGILGFSCNYLISGVNWCLEIGPSAMDVSQASCICEKFRQYRILFNHPLWDGCVNYGRPGDYQSALNLGKQYNCID